MARPKDAAGIVPWLVTFLPPQTKFDNQVPTELQPRAELVCELPSGDVWVREAGDAGRQ
jgi:hypothetical protein